MISIKKNICVYKKHVLCINISKVKKLFFVKIIFNKKCKYLYTINIKYSSFAYLENYIILFLSKYTHDKIIIQCFKNKHLFFLLKNVSFKLFKWIIYNINKLKYIIYIKVNYIIKTFLRKYNSYFYLNFDKKLKKHYLWYTYIKLNNETSNKADDDCFSYFLVESFLYKNFQIEDWYDSIEHYWLKNEIEIMDFFFQKYITYQKEFYTKLSLKLFNNFCDNFVIEAEYLCIGVNFLDDKILEKVQLECAKLFYYKKKEFIKKKNLFFNFLIKLHVDSFFETLYTEIVYEIKHLLTKCFPLIFINFTLTDLSFKEDIYLLINTYEFFMFEKIVIQWFNSFKYHYVIFFEQNKTLKKIIDFRIKECIVLHFKIFLSEFYIFFTTINFNIFYMECLHFYKHIVFYVLQKDIFSFYLLYKHKFTVKVLTNTKYNLNKFELLLFENLSQSYSILKEINEVYGILLNQVFRYNNNLEDINISNLFFTIENFYIKDILNLICLIQFCFFCWNFFRTMLTLNIEIEEESEDVSSSDLETRFLLNFEKKEKKEIDLVLQELLIFEHTLTFGLRHFNTLFFFFYKYEQYFRTKTNNINVCDTNNLIKFYSIIILFLNKNKKENEQHLNSINKYNFYKGLDIYSFLNKVLIDYDKYV